MNLKTEESHSSSLQKDLQNFAELGQEQGELENDMETGPLPSISSPKPAAISRDTSPRALDVSYLVLHPRNMAPLASSPRALPSIENNGNTKYLNKYGVDAHVKTGDQRTPDYDPATLKSDFRIHTKFKNSLAKRHDSRVEGLSPRQEGGLESPTNGG